MEEPEQKFVFDEHILQIPDLQPRIERLERLISLKRSFPFRFFLRTRLEHLQWQQEHAYERYEDLRSFFEMACSNSRNRITYDPQRNKVRLLGSGTEILRCDGEPVFYRSNPNTEETLIPVSVGTDHEAFIRFHRYPQEEVSAFDDLEVSYSFDTSFSLGGRYSDTFTKRILKTYKVRWDSSNFHDCHTFFGSPGRVYYRFADALYEELSKSVFMDYCASGSLPTDHFPRRSNLNLFGKISIKGSNRLLYQGNFKCYNTNFPFFIEQPPSDNRKVSIVPSSGACLK